MVCEHFVSRKAYRYHQAYGITNPCGTSYSVCSSLAPNQGQHFARIMRLGVEPLGVWKYFFCDYALSLAGLRPPPRAPGKKVI